MARVKGWLTYANVMATVAVFIALGAGAYAAGLARDTVKSKQIKAGAVKADELADNAVTSPKVANGSLLSEDFAGGQLPSGQQGPQGERGLQGAQGTPGEPGEPGLSGLVQVTNASANDSISSKSAVATCPPGKVAISGSADINGGTTGSSPDQLTDVVITNSGSPSPETTVPGTVFARAHEEEPHAGSWNVQVRGICANASP